MKQTTFKTLDESIWPQKDIDKLCEAYDQFLTDRTYEYDKKYLVYFDNRNNFTHIVDKNIEVAIHYNPNKPRIYYV
tara:strand:- start:7042 stop:7269 length:228 start_codon:yes stop_codon:yes gene_type:complete